MSIWLGEPSTLTPARAGDIASVARIWLFTRFVAREHEAKAVRALAVAAFAAIAAAALPAGRPLQPVPGGERLVAGEHELALPLGEYGVETRLVQRIRRYGHRLLPPDFLQRAAIDRRPRGPRHRRAGPGNNPLPVIEVLAVWI
jgi:hypothetical protein